VRAICDPDEIKPGSLAGVSTIGCLLGRGGTTLQPRYGLCRQRPGREGGDDRGTLSDRPWRPGPRRRPCSRSTAWSPRSPATPHDWPRRADCRRAGPGPAFRCGSQQGCGPARRRERWLACSLAERGSGRMEHSARSGRARGCRQGRHVADFNTAHGNAGHPSGSARPVPAKNRGGCRPGLRSSMGEPMALAGGGDMRTRPSCGRRHPALPTLAPAKRELG